VAQRPGIRKKRRVGSLRTSVSLPIALHRELEQIARQKKVSLAWVIRDAAEGYIEGKWPLLSRST